MKSKGTGHQNKRYLITTQGNYTVLAFNLDELWTYYGEIVTMYKLNNVNNFDNGPITVLDVHENGIYCATNVNGIVIAWTKSMTLDEAKRRYIQISLGDKMEWDRFGEQDFANSGLSMDMGKTFLLNMLKKFFTVKEFEALMIPKSEFYDE